MSPVSQLSLLAFASAALATPFAGHGHAHNHERLHSASWAHSSDNCTTGVAASTGSFTRSFPGSYTGSFTRTRHHASSVAPVATSSVPVANTWTSQATSYETVWSTISLASSQVSVAAVSSSSVECSDVTVTSTSQYYVTVTGAPSCSEESAGETSSPVEITQTVTAPTAAPYGLPSQSASSEGPEAPGYGKPHVPSSVAAPWSSAPAPEDSTPASSAPAYSVPASTPVAESTTETPSAAPAAETSAVVSSSLAAPVTTAAPATTAAPEESSSAPSVAYSAPPAASSASPSPATGGKRGLAYNDASLNAPFSGSKHVSWAYNWVSSSAGLSDEWKFIPTLHSGESTFTNIWNSDAESAISSGSTHLFSFNEPDIPSQANMAPAAAASAYKQYMNPLAGKAQLCAPAVSNGAGPTMGLAYLKSFLEACDGDCNIDCFNVHWYNPNLDVSDFKTFVSGALEIANNYKSGTPLYVSEFAIPLSDDDVNDFLHQVLPWLDSNGQIEGYAYFMVQDGKLVNGDALSPYGTTYSTYSG